MKDLLKFALVLALSYLGYLLAGIGGALVLFVLANAALARVTPEQLTKLCLVTPATEFSQNTVLQAALRAYKRAILPITVFATAFKDVPLRKNKNAKVEVPYYPLNTVASKDWDADDCYIFDDTYTIATREITINKRKYQPISMTSDEWNRGGDLISYETVFEMAGEKLAYDVILDVMSVITAANFGTAAFIGADTTFDSDDIADMTVIADNLYWPLVGRGMVVKPAYKGNLFKDNDVKLEYALGDDGVIKDGVLPRVLGYNFGWTPGIPANGENLVGFISHMSALLFAQSPIQPAPAVMKTLVNYDVVTDPDTGITIEHRIWGDPDCDEERHVIEANYGYAKGNEDALRRMTSA